jgi:putative transposase
MVLRGILDHLRVLYNACLEQRIDAWHKQRVSLSRYDQHKELTVLRAEDEAYRALPVVMVRMTVINRLDFAFKDFFRRVRSGETPGFPRFRGENRFNTLIFGKQSWKIDGKWLILNIGSEPIRLRMKNAIHRQGEIIGLRIIQKGERWWAHFIVDIGDAPKVRPSYNGVGIDVGLKSFVTLSNGEQIAHPRFLRKSTDALRAAQQALSRCKRGSNRRKKAKRTLARAHECVANQRRDFARQTVAILVNKYDGFAVEDLNIQRMIQSSPEGLTQKQTRGLHRGIMDAGWGQFTKSLAYKAEEAGMPCTRVNPRGTTQRCSDCGSLVRKNLRDRVHSCTACGLILDRDVNAARNIYALGVVQGMTRESGQHWSC